VAALSIGGQSSPDRGGDHATARDHQGRLVIPASALRGALRIELERLLLGRDGDGVVCNPNQSPSTDPRHPCDCAVCRLFGEQGGATGTLRLEDAVLRTAFQPTVVRPRIAVSRRTRTVVDQHLGFLETSDLLGGDLGADLPAAEVFRAAARLVPRGPAETSAALAEDLQNLRAACAALTAIGGGRARGLGWVECALVEDPAATAAPDPDAPAGQPQPGTVALRLCFEAQAPLHLGQGRPIAFFQPTLAHAPASTVRGAVSFALLEGGLCGAADEAFQALAERATFGSARMEGDVPSASRRRCRPFEHIFDALVEEILQRQAARYGVALATTAGRVCAHPGCRAPKVVAHSRRAGAPLPVQRVRSRTALNRLTATAMDQKLYSVEVLEPLALPGGGASALPGPLRLHAEVRGLEPGSAALLHALNGREIWLGGKRSKGMGRCRLTIEQGPSSTPHTIANAVAAAAATTEALSRAIEDGWQTVRAAAPALRQQLLAEDELALALVLTEPWSPDVAAHELVAELHAGPLAAPPAATASPALRRLDAFLTLGEEGRFGANEARRYGGAEALTGEMPPRLMAAAGSVYVYAVGRELLRSRLAAWVEQGLLGAGVNHTIGWGRFAVRGPDPDF
jgi:CRISPR-associated protein Csx10